MRLPLILATATLGLIGTAAAQADLRDEQDRHACRAARGDVLGEDRMCLDEQCRGDGGRDGCPERVGARLHPLERPAEVDGGRPAA